MSIREKIIRFLGRIAHEVNDTEEWPTASTSHITVNLDTPSIGKATIGDPLEALQFLGAADRQSIFEFEEIRTDFVPKGGERSSQFSWNKLGILVHCSPDLIITEFFVLFQPDVEEQCEPYSGDFTFANVQLQLSSETTQEYLTQKLGQPEDVRTMKNLSIVESSGRIVRYDWPTCSASFVFNPDGKLFLLSARKPLPVDVCS